MTKLVLLDDAPVGRGATSNVGFNHSLYAGLLRDVLLDNASGICIGFFARWGQGKSTVINLLQSLLGTKADLIVFNAYQARGDSVRRQMLLSILRAIDPEQAEEFQRFTQVVTPLELQSAVVQERFEGGQLLQLLMKSKGDLPLLITAGAAAVSGVFLAWYGGTVLFTDAVYADKEQAIVGALTAAFLAFAAFVVRWLQSHKDKILAYTQPVSDSQRLKYPEQFSRVFQEAVRKFNRKQGRRLILVVDDLDRCDPNTVVEALASVRHFCHGEHPSALDCQFLMPCDEKQMLSALEADGYNFHDYSRTEMLRKFFDVIVRMDEIVPESLANFAAEQARLIGVDPGMARDMVDAAAVREPRKVKALLNAYRLACEAVSRNQAAETLPPADQLDRLAHTLAALVCLQEFAPVTYEAIRLNPDALSDGDLGSDKEPIVQRILAGLGPVSVSTADVLITKQNEPSLRGSAVAHALPAADRNYQVAEVAKMFKDASVSDREKMTAWVTHKIRAARSNTRLKELITYLVEIDRIIPWPLDAREKLVAELPRRRFLLPEALRLGERVYDFGVLVEPIQSRARFIFDGIIVKNYLGAPDLNHGEERYVLRFANRMVPADAEVLRRGIEHSLFTNNGPKPERLHALAATLATESPEAAFGFAPNAGERLFNELVSDDLGQELYASSLTVGLRFVGGDQHVATRLLAQVVSRLIKGDGETLSDRFFKNHGIYFQLLQGLLAATPRLEAFSAFFDERYAPWLTQQEAGEPRLRLLSSIQPGWGMLSETQLARLTREVAGWIVDDEAFARAAVTVIDSPARADEAWLEGRDAIRSELFASLAQRDSSRPALPLALAIFFDEALKADWKVGPMAERLLASKVRQFAQHEEGSAQELEEWRLKLTPFCPRELLEVRKAVLENIGATDRPVLLSSFARRAIWSAIPPEVAAPLADAVLRMPQVLVNKDGTANDLLKTPGFEEVARVLFKHLPGKGAEWMHEEAQLMKVLSTWAATDRNAAQRFQGAGIDTLLTSANSEFEILGLDLLKDHSHITADIRRSLEGWSHRFDEGDAARKNIEETSRRPLFDGASDSFWQ